MTQNSRACCIASQQGSLRGHPTCRTAPAPHMCVHLCCEGLHSGQPPAAHHAFVHTLFSLPRPWCHAGLLPAWPLAPKRPHSCQVCAAYRSLCCTCCSLPLARAVSGCTSSLFCTLSQKSPGSPCCAGPAPDSFTHAPRCLPKPMSLALSVVQASNQGSLRPRTSRAQPGTPQVGSSVPAEDSPEPPSDDSGEPPEIALPTPV